MDNHGDQGTNPFAAGVYLEVTSFDLIMAGGGSTARYNCDASNSVSEPDGARVADDYPGMCQ